MICLVYAWLPLCEDLAEIFRISGNDSVLQIPPQQSDRDLSVPYSSLIIYCHLLATAVCGPSNPEPDDNDFFWLAFAPLSYLFRYHYSNFHLHHDVPSNILLLSAGPDIACTCLHWAANQSIFIDESPTKYRQNHYPSTTDQHISICRE